MLLTEMKFSTSDFQKSRYLGADGSLEKTHEFETVFVK